MLLTKRAKEWHEVDTGLITSLADYWDELPQWNKAGVPTVLPRGEDTGYGLSSVFKRRLGYQHTIFSKKSPHMSATITQYIASQFAYHLDFPLAPVLFGPGQQDMH